MRISAILALAALGCGLSASWSASVVRMNIDELTKRSDTAVVGKVTSISHASEAGRYPETLYHLTVLETFYGEEDAKNLTICLPGGPAGSNRTTVVPGMPKFKKDEKVAVFLVLDKTRNVAVPTGLEQGVFRIQVDPETKQEYVVNQTVELKFKSLEKVTEKSGKALGPSPEEFGKVIKEKAKELKSDE